MTQTSAERLQRSRKVDFGKLVVFRTDVALSKAVCVKALCAEEKFTCSVNVFILYKEIQSYKLYRISKLVAGLTAYFQYIKPQWKVPFK